MFKQKDTSAKIKIFFGLIIIYNFINYMPGQ